MHILSPVVKWLLASSSGNVCYLRDNSVLTLIHSLALSIKMNILLYVPGLLIILLKTLGLFDSFIHLGIIFVIQMWLGLPFIIPYPRSYFSNAFDLSRQFLYKWTVNWRFIAEDVFLSKRFALSLLVGHLSVLCLFVLRRWFANEGGLIATIKRAFNGPLRRASLELPSGDRMLFHSFWTTALTLILEIITILFTSNFIGIVFARSLHYQFYSWYAQQLPLLLWRTRYPTPVRYVKCAINYFFSDWCL